MDKCKCGSNEFFLNEYVFYKADLEKGVLKLYDSTDSEFERIFCSKCDTTYEYSDFSSIE